MSARLKKYCKGSCGKRKNLKFDPEGKLCTDCLIEWRDDLISQHKNGKLTFQDCLEQVTKRCRMGEDEALILIFPPLDDSIDFQHGAMELTFDMDRIRKQEESE